MTNQKIKRALISVSDKSGIKELAQFLVENGVEIISTGGTFKALQEAKIKVKDISEFTGFPEILDGRVKTLHPKVHGGLLAVLDDSNHQKQVKENNLESIDLVLINLYPFVATVNKGASHNEIIENIDIGGPSMIRSSAKNHAFKTVITDPQDYPFLIEQMEQNQGSTTFEFRQNLAAKAFNLTANYDAAISSYFSNYLKQNLTNKLVLPASLKQELRYGENSHQKAGIYTWDLKHSTSLIKPPLPLKSGTDSIPSGIAGAKQLQGKELSYNNFNDADAAFNLILEFSMPAAAVIKHANPCGVAISDSIENAFAKALAADPKSAFGGIVALNREVDAKLAEELSKIFFEVIIAPKFSAEALEILGKKKNLRLLEVVLKADLSPQIKSISGGILVQDQDSKILKLSDLKQVSNKTASKEELEELLFAMSICKHVKSNAIVITKDFQTVGIGCGQTSRVDSVEIACAKAANFKNEKEEIENRSQNSVLASDAFFPFADGLEFAAKSGVKAFVAPSGSVRDQEVIDAANSHGVALYFIDSRHFKH